MSLQFTAGVTRLGWEGVDKDWEREKLEARKKAKKRADSHLSGARIVSWRFDLKTLLVSKCSL